MLYERFANIPIKLLNIISDCSVNVQNIYFLNVYFFLGYMNVIENFKVHPKMKILSLIYSPSCCSKLVRLIVFIFGHNLKYFLMNPRDFWLSINSNATDTFNAQKGSKEIVKIVHVTWREEIVE